MGADHGRADAIHELYIDDGELTLPNGPVRGRDALRAWGRQIARELAPHWGNIQILIVTSIVATGAGLRVAASFLGGVAMLPRIAAVLAVAVPVAMYLALVHALHWYLVRSFGKIDTWLLVVSNGLAVLSALAALAGISMPACLVIVMFAPALTVVANEVLRTRGAREVDAVLEGG